MPKPIVFISHITEEKEFAETVKMLIKKSYLGAVEIFVSSDQDSIEAGSKWLNKVNDALKDCVIELVLCSEISVKRSWINFEAGAGWVRDIPTIPVCHSGMKNGSLPVPLNSLQAVNLNDKEGINRIFSVISKALELDVPTPDLDTFVNEVKEKEARYMVGKDMRKFLDVIGGCEKALNSLKSIPNEEVGLRLGSIAVADYDNIVKHITPSIKKYIKIEKHNPALCFHGDNPMRSEIEVAVVISNKSEVIRLCKNEMM